MRKGVLVEEGSPQNILAKYDTNSLEESFVIACCGQETNEVPITQVLLNQILLLIISTYT